MLPSTNQFKFAFSKYSNSCRSDFSHSCKPTEVTNFFCPSKYHFHIHKNILCLHGETRIQDEFAAKQLLCSQSSQGKQLPPRWVFVPSLARLLPHTVPPLLSEAHTGTSTTWPPLLRPERGSRDKCCTPWVNASSEHNRSRPNQAVR